MIGHVGSTSAHPCCLCVLRALKATRPQLITVYGGVHLPYHDRAILAEHPQVDVIVMTCVYLTISYFGEGVEWERHSSAIMALNHQLLQSPIRVVTPNFNILFTST